jgi:alpha-N-arabinofuranosidase
VPYLKLAAVHDDAAGSLTLFMLNRHLSEPIEVELSLRGFGDVAVGSAHQLQDADLQAVNTKDEPDRIRPASLDTVRVADGGASAKLASLSWNVVRFVAR